MEEPIWENMQDFSDYVEQDALRYDRVFTDYDG